MPVVFDTSTIAPREQTDMLSTAMAEASAPLHVIVEDPDGVAADFDVWQFGDASIFQARTAGNQPIRISDQALTTPTPVLAIAVQRARDGHYQQDNAQRVVAPGELHIMDLHAPYDFRWTADGASTCLYVPLDLLGLPTEVIRRAAARVRESPHYRLVADHILALTRDADALSADPAAALAGLATIELVRGLLLSASESGGGAAVVPTDILLTRIRAYVHQHLADPDLGAEQIARAHSVSVRYLYKVCANAEYSLEQWIIGQRLDRVRAELVRPDSRHRSIAMIARRWGFRDPSHFARRFRAAYGMSPREWRHEAAQGAGG
ncbi:helix-turn-helix domain-containing protein [Nocardia sp. CA-107356]|uniref:helix-turn-helix domain-containing protein n=1 Tax=Nocardia sp. CA-107356 TaxID=3239972 RepID=UPI003D90219F